MKVKANATVEMIVLAEGTWDEKCAIDLATRQAKRSVEEVVNKILKDHQDKVIQFTIKTTRVVVSDEK